MITKWQVGDRVVITSDSFRNIHDSGRSILAFPSDSYIAKAASIMLSGIQGTVSRTFPPGYEVNVEFDNGVILQVKDHWIERVVA